MVLRLFDSFLRSRDGSISIITAIIGSVIIGFVALTLDIGTLFYQKRQQQAATDLAALAAAGTLGNMTAAAAASLAANGFSTPDIAAIETGIYVPDADVASTYRFTAQTGGMPNAVRVTLKKVRPVLFAPFVGFATGSTPTSPGGILITTQSVAAARNMATFSLGSGLVTLDNGIANSVMSGLLGGGVSLSLMDYQALAVANVNVFAFSNALATRAGITAGTYTSLGSSSVSLAAGLKSIGDAVVSPSSQFSPALAAIVAAVGSPSMALPFGELIDYGPYGGMNIGSPPPITTSVNALNMILAILQLANGQHQVEATLNISQPGISKALLALSIGEAAVGSSLIAMGPQGTTLTTSQTRFQLFLQISGPPQAPLLNLPLTFTIASASTVLNTVQCSGGTISTSVVQLGVTPGLADAWIGVVSSADLANFATPLNPPAATLVNLFGVLSVTAQAHAAVANASATNVAFTYSDIMGASAKTVSMNDYVSPLVSTLLNNTQVGISLYGANLIDTAALKLAILQTLASDAAPIDTILASVLATLGISVGNATVWVSGVQCGQSVLVN